ncbi:MAG: DUF4097 family beta strand repeat-containing protein [Acidobacteria bacterium]|nr:DUF4097 family beta strand repeat-containing protein [Acidobacteriota bacterium]
MSNKSLMSLLVAGALLCPLGGATAAQSRTETQARPDLTEEFHQSYSLPAGGRVSLSNINGDVRITGWDRNEVRVDAVKRAYARERLAEARIKVNADADSVRIETEYPSHDLNWSNGERRYDNPATVEYRLSVPRNARIEEVNLVNGALDLENLTGPVRASSVNGHVAARRLSGTVKLSVVNGRLEASLDRLSEGSAIALSSVNGPLVLTIPSDTRAVLKANTIQGSISNDFNLPVRVGRYVGRDLEGRLGSGGPSIKLNNVSGPITIHRAADNLPLSPATNLLSETSKGDYFDEQAVQREAERAAREAERGVRDAAREAERERRDAQREAERERRESLSEAQREKENAERDAQHEREESQREAERERRDAQRERLEAQRDAQREASREIARHSQEIAREANRSVQREMSRHKVFVGDSRRVIDRVTNSFPTGNAPRVRVETFDGPVIVHAWDKNEVMYTALKRAHDDNEMKGIKLSTRADNTRHTDSKAGTATSSSEVTIRADFDKSFAREVVERNGRVVSFNSGASVELDVYVPRDATLSVSSGDGRLSVEGVSGQVDLHTGDGPIDVTGGRGQLRAETGDGRIRIEGFDGDADARTGDGRITLDGRFRQLSAQTGDGTISLAIPADLNITIETNSDTVISDGVAVAEDAEQKRVRRWRVGSGGQVFRLHTGDGQIILRRR